MTADRSKSQLIPVADDPGSVRVTAKDENADRQFWHSVTTTGVYCRRSCPSCTANPKNVTLLGARAAFDGKVGKRHNPQQKEERPR